MDSIVEKADEYFSLKHNKEKDAWIEKNIKPLNFKLSPYVTKENGYDIVGMLDEDNVLLTVDMTPMIMDKRSLM